MVSEDELNALIVQMVQAGRDKDFERFRGINGVFSEKDTIFRKERDLPSRISNKWDQARNKVVNFFHELLEGRDAPVFLDEALKLVE